MSFDSSHVIGVNLSLMAIRLFSCDLEGRIFAITEESLPKPSMPGAVTVSICEGIDSIDPQRNATLVAVSLKGVLNESGKVVKSWNTHSEWIDVPLAFWLEPRLNRNVSLCTDKQCCLDYLSWMSCSDRFNEMELLSATIPCSVLQYFRSLVAKSNPFLGS